ncbi:hypothetical protein TOPH_08244 [Tolypocladium ophioglossoides CBS 100239]|uniref:Uncharacterized protein n=1 Tax=Tolypocladium ophioglossoides (strain CBS 100239) TaxID=1163406 RepID=A0A0L0N033_TOLOC|nr:hypothetical protein TOPH_08244 [Tolypocladium ophioglossoides CBS 100239]
MDVVPGGARKYSGYDPRAAQSQIYKLNTHNIFYSVDADGSDVMVPVRDGRLDLEIERAFGADFKGADFKLASRSAEERVGEPVGGA